MELGHFDKLSSNAQEKGLAGKNFGAFSPRYS